MPFTNDVPATVVPDHPNPLFDNATEVKGQYPDEHVPPEAPPPEGTVLVDPNAPAIEGANV